MRELNTTLESKVAQRTAELAYRARQLQRLTLKLTQAEEQERRRIAVILHEGLQQQMAGAKFHLNLVKGKIKDDRLRADIDEVGAILKSAIEQSRSLSRDLSPAVANMSDLAEVLQWLTHRIRAQQGLIVNLVVSGDLRLHSEPLAMFLSRAAQEMLLNVVKHAQVREAAVRVRRIGRYVGLSVSDSGRGFDPRELKETSGMGVFSIRERTELLGGRMKIKSAPGKGSRFGIVVPDGPKAKDGERRQKVPLLLCGCSRLPPVLQRGRPARPSGGRSRCCACGSGGDAPGNLRHRTGRGSDRRSQGGRDGDGPAAGRGDYGCLHAPDEGGRSHATDQDVPARHPRDRVSMYDEAKKKQSMFEAGADGYILKTISAEDLIAAIRGRSTREVEQTEFPEIGRRVRTFKEQHPEAHVISMGIGDVTQPLAPTVIKAMHGAVDEMGKQQTFHGYDDGGVGYEFLRKAIVENDYKARGAQVEMDEVFVSDGAKPDTGNMQEIFGVDSVVAVADPVYPVYVDTNVMAGRTGPGDERGQYSGIVYMPATAENGFVPQPPDKPVDLIYLCFPNNPTGAVATKEDLTRWVEYAREVKAVIFFDAAYEAFISNPRSPIRSMRSRGRGTSRSSFAASRRPPASPAFAAPSASSPRR